MREVLAVLAYRVDWRKLDQRFDRRFGPWPKPRLVRSTLEAARAGRRAPRTWVDSSRGLVDPGTVNSSAFRKLAMGVHDYSGVHPELLRFKRALERELWKAQCFPFLCIYLGQDYLRYVHYPKRYDLFIAEWEVVGGIAAEIAIALDVPILWGGDRRGETFEPSLWELGDVGDGRRSASADAKLDASMRRAWRIVSETHRSWSRHDRASCPACAWVDGGELGEPVPGELVEVGELVEPPARTEADGFIRPRSLLDSWPRW